MHHCKRYRSPEREGCLGPRWRRKRSRSGDCVGRLRCPPRRALPRRSRSRRWERGRAGGESGDPHPSSVPLGAERVPDCCGPAPGPSVPGVEGKGW